MKQGTPPFASMTARVDVRCNKFLHCSQCSSSESGQWANTWQTPLSIFMSSEIAKGCFRAFTLVHPNNIFPCWNPFSHFIGRIVDCTCPGQASQSLHSSHAVIIDKILHIKGRARSLFMVIPLWTLQLNLMSFPIRLWWTSQMNLGSLTSYVYYYWGFTTITKMFGGNIF